MAPRCANQLCGPAAQHSPPSPLHSTLSNEEIATRSPPPPPPCTKHHHRGHNHSSPSTPEHLAVVVKSLSQPTKAAASLNGVFTLIISASTLLLLPTPVREVVMVVAAWPSLTHPAAWLPAAPPLPGHAQASHDTMFRGCRATTRPLARLAPRGVL
ncbi:hypothetical protein O3P69_006959 [Scylla paramamosain]|uniref:Uncharacterized protein n=1 Tax=Scylla paramamosain TaxID=85552 RepID=A0AAW0V4U9_SCYPA